MHVWRVFHKKRKYGTIADNTINRRINYIGNYMENEILKRVHSSPFFAIELDESTDITNLANLQVFVRYINGDYVQEELLFCRRFKERTTGEDLFKLTDKYTHGNANTGIAVLVFVHMVQNLSLGVMRDLLRERNR